MTAPRRHASARSPRALAAPTSTPFLRAVSLAFVLVAAWALAPVSGASAAVQGNRITQCNGIDNVGGELVRCTVTIVNTVDHTGEIGSAQSIAVLEECRGAAGAEPLCTITTHRSSDTFFSIVDQCNGAANGGGSDLECSVDVTNNYLGFDSITSPATVNQCVDAGQGGGTEPTTVCVAASPLVPTAGAAQITQCNEAGNGGGGTERVQCSVDSDSSYPSSDTTSTIRQCVGSGNGGGGTVTCSASVNTNIVPPVEEPPVEEPPVEEPPVEEPPVEEPPVEEPPLVAPPVVTPPVVTPPVVTPPVVTPPVVTPPVVTPPGVDPPVFRANPPVVVTSPPGNRLTPPDRTLQRLPRTGVDSAWLVLTSVLLVSAGWAVFSLSNRIGRRSTSA